ncbi:MAG TPA: polymer-forming cytoskeletal protein [Tepidisphaeraceae bacterium]|jgi:hypothetical protein|nr:polymer-forming cytoskeletal protein [Tepidisphaeraceae bacterium]
MFSRHRSIDPFKGNSARKSSTKVRKASRMIAEALEDRVMLAATYNGPVTLTPGQSFVFGNEDSTTGTFVPQTITALGNTPAGGNAPPSISATIIGANVDGYDRPSLEDLPGTMYNTIADLQNNTNPILVNGGPGIPPAEKPVPDAATLAANPAAPAPAPIVINGLVAGGIPAALAVDPNDPPNTLYGLVLQSIPPAMPGGMATNGLYIVKFDSSYGTTNTGLGTVVAEISTEVVAQSGATGTNVNVTAIQGLTYDPIDGDLYFMATTGALTANGAGTTQGIYHFNPDAGGGSAAAVALTVLGDGEFAMSNTVLGNTAIVYDSLGLNGAPAGSFTIASGMDIFDVNPAGIYKNGNTFVPFPKDTVTTAGPIGALLIAPDPVLLKPELYATDGKELYVITGGVTIDYGPLGPVSTIGGLAYDPVTKTAYTDDVIANGLYSVDLMNRTRSLSVFQIYISQSDSSGKIITYAGAGAPYNAPPLNGFTIEPANGGPLVNIAGPPTGGDALIGARTRLIPIVPITPYVPYQTLPVTPNSTFGPVGYVVGANITPGIVSATGTDVGEVLVAGPVMGAVAFGGNIGLFYCNWLLTGTVNGSINHTDFPDYTLPNPDNFTVAGSIGSLIVLNSIGEDDGINPIYRTAFDMHVAGTIGEVRSYDGIFGNINADDSPFAITDTDPTPQTEINPGVPMNVAVGLFEFSGELTGIPMGTVGGVSNPTVFRNDDFYNPQYIGAISTAAGEAPSQSVVTGTLYADAVNQNFVDYYAVALMAGQTITAQVTDPLDVLHLGIYNPEDMLVASDFNSVSPSTTQEQPFKYTVTEPGIYRFSVTNELNLGFSDAYPDQLIGDFGYTMTVQAVGNLAIGAIAARTGIQPDLAASPTFGAANGDIGAITGEAQVASTAAAPDPSKIGPERITVQNGNFRDIDAGSIGDPTFNFPNPIVTIPNGGLGRVDATSGDLVFDVPPLIEGPPPVIGGDIQETSAAGDYQAILLSDGNIGVIKADAMTLDGNDDGVYPLWSTFQVNAGNNIATPGSIDLVDVTGDLGTLISGPHFITGPEGNVGYVRVGGEAYRDNTFGGGTPETTEYQPGESVTLTDDSGAAVTITPTGIPGAIYPGNPEPPTQGGVSPGGTLVNPALPQLEITAIGIEGEPGVDAGGVAITQIISTGGVTVDGEGDVPGQTVQIGQIITAGIGTPLIATPPAVVAAPVTTPTVTPVVGPVYFPAPHSAGPVGRTFLQNPPPEIDPATVAATSYNVLITGAARIDVFETYACDTTNPGIFPSTNIIGGNAELNSVVNKTTGDIVNMEAASVGLLEDDGGQIGLSVSHTGVALNGEQVLEDAFPLLQAHNVVDIRGQSDGYIGAAIGTLIAPNGIGNFDVQGSIGNMTASILGPVEVALPSLTMSDVATINALTLTGSGIASSGSGEGSNAGLYVSGVIGQINNATPNDIRGNLVSNVAFEGISISGGSIINSVIGVFAPGAPTLVLPVQTATFGNYTGTMVSATWNAGFQTSSIEGGTNALTTFLSPITNPIYDLGNVSVSGNGGIIGSDIRATHIGAVGAHGGFGIISTSISTTGAGTLASLYADGYGLRDDSFDGGASVGSITANGNGTNVSTQIFSSDVRISQSNSFDPYFGFAPDDLTDIDVALGATAAAPTNADTQTGVIKDSSFDGSRDLGSVRAYLITATYPNSTNFDFANSIGTVTSTSDMINTNFITGRIDTFAPGGNLNNFSLTVSGTMRSLKIHGNVEGNSAIVAGGINGVIGSIVVNGSVQGTIKAARKITSANIIGNLTGAVTAPIIGALKIGGSINGGNLTITGSIGTLTTKGDLATPGESLMINGSVKSIKIGGNLNANISVSGALGSLTVGQSILSGTVTDISGVLTSLAVRGDVQSNATVTAALIKHKKIKGLIEGMVS